MPKIASLKSPYYFPVIIIIIVLLRGTSDYWYWPTNMKRFFRGIENGIHYPISPFSFDVEEALYFARFDVLQKDASGQNLPLSGRLFVTNLRITFIPFLSLYEKDIFQMFYKLRQGNDSHLSVSNLKKEFYNIAKDGNLPNVLSDQFFAMLDANNDGCISLHELIDFMCSNHDRYPNEEIRTKTTLSIPIPSISNIYQETVRNDMELGESLNLSSMIGVSITSVEDIRGFRSEVYTITVSFDRNEGLSLIYCILS